MTAVTIPGLDWLYQAIAYALHWLSSLVGGNYGVAIILLTIVMRIIILPLSIKQTKSMIAMQKLQPQLKEIQKKYKDDREKMGQEMMKLYKENKVSPLGGCLPLLLQLPILFAMFEVLNSLSNPKSDYFAILFPGQRPPATKAAISSWVASAPQLQFLGMNITYTGQKLWTSGDYVQVVTLVVLTVATGYVSAKMMTVDPRQSKMMAIMPLMMGIFAWILPAGVTIYFITTNLFTMVQQYVQLEHEGFYDEKLAGLRKLGDDAKLYQRLYLKFMETGTTAMVAVRLREKPKVKSRKQASGPGSKASGTGSTSEPKAQQATSQAKKPAQTKAKAASTAKSDKPQATGSKKTKSAKAGQNQGKAQKYPAKKKSTKK